MRLISTVYAICQKSTGHFLPMRFGSGRVYSFDSPTPDCVPRLFKSKNSANRALTAWLQGEWKNEWHSRGGSGFFPPEDYMRPSPEKVEGRNRENMEIVELSLLDCSLSQLTENVQL